MCVWWREEERREEGVEWVGGWEEWSVGCGGDGGGGGSDTVVNDDALRMHLIMVDCPCGHGPRPCTCV